MPQAKNECLLLSYPGATHGFFNYNPDGNPFFEQTSEAIDLFLIDHDFLSGSPSIESFSYQGQAKVPVRNKN